MLALGVTVLAVLIFESLEVAVAWAVLGGCVLVLMKCFPKQFNTKE
jgi:hypothetical protein